MTNKPLVSLIIPAYQAEAYLAETLDSALKQDYPNLEIIVVDDGSTDQTKSIILKYAQKDNRIKYIYQSNKGLGGTRNTGIRMAKGKYFANLDADDIALPNFVSQMVEKMEQAPDKTIAISPNAQFYYQGKPLKATFYGAYNAPEQITLQNELEGNSIPSTALINRELIIKLGYYQETRHREDYDFWLRALAQDYRIEMIQKPLFYYRIHQANLSTNFEKTSQTDIALFQRLINDPIFQKHQSLIQKRLSDSYCGLANHYLLNNQRKKALENYQEAKNVQTSKKVQVLSFLAKFWPGLAKLMIKTKRKSSHNPKERIQG